MPLTFDWSYFWSYYQRSEYPEVRAKMRDELIADNWLGSQPSEVQIVVLKDAPEDFIEEVKGSLKPDTIKALSPESNLIDWSKL